MLGKEINVQVIQISKIQDFRKALCNELHYCLADCEIISIEYSTLEIDRIALKYDPVFYSAIILYKGTRIEGSIPTIPKEKKNLFHKKRKEEPI